MSKKKEQNRDLFKEDEYLHKFTSNQRVYLNHLKLALGRESKALQSSGFSRRAVWLWKRDNEDFRDAVELAKEEVVDIVEDRMMQKIEDGDSRLIMYFLDAQGRSRGYGKVQKIDITSNGETISGSERKVIEADVTLNFGLGANESIIENVNKSNEKEN